MLELDLKEKEIEKVKQE